VVIAVTIFTRVEISWVEGSEGMVDEHEVPGTFLNNLHRLEETVAVSPTPCPIHQFMEIDIPNRFLHIFHILPKGRGSQNQHADEDKYFLHVSLLGLDIGLLCFLVAAATEDI